MATILRFERPRTRPGRTSPAPKGPATVIPFLGVRKESLGGPRETARLAAADGETPAPN